MKASRVLSRAAIRWACALTSVGFGLAALYLFCGTAKTIPHQFATWSDLGCSSPWQGIDNPMITRDKPEFLCFSECGRYYATSQPSTGSGAAGTDKLAIHETASKKIVGRIDFRGDYVNDFCISGDGNFLAIVYEYEHLQICRWPSCQEVHRRIDLKPFGAASIVNLPESQTVLLSTYNSGSLWDLESGKLLGSYHAPIFLQPDGDLKEIRVRFDWDLKLRLASNPTPNWEIPSDADYARRKQYYQLDHRYSRMSFGLTEPVLSADGMKLAEMNTHPGISIRSVASGELLGRSPHFDGELFSPQFSPDACFLTFFGIRQNAWNGFLNRFPQFLHMDRLGLADDKAEVVLMDLQSGVSWSGILGSLRGSASGTHVRFIEKESQLVTLTKEGMFQWTLPPHRRAFTHWAWPTLVISIVQGWGWWRLRGRHGVKLTISA